MTKQALVTKQTIFDGSTVAPGARVFIYESGTTSPVTVYTNSTLTTPHASPIVADGDGVVPDVFYGGAAALKAVVQDSSGATIYTVDPAPLVGATGSAAADISFAPVTGNANSNVQAAIAANTAAREGRSANVKTLLGAANNAEMRSDLGLGSAALMVDSASTDLTVDPDGAARRDVVKAYVDAEIATATAAPQVLASVSFDGSAPPSILTSYNVASITRLGTGRYEVNFTNSLPSSAYTAVASDNNPQTAVAVASTSVDKCTVEINTTISSASGQVDSTEIGVIVIG